MIFFLCFPKILFVPLGASVYSAMNAVQDGDIIDLTATTYNNAGSAYILRSFTLRCASLGRAMTHFLM
jgi:hypothetical protein